MIYTANIKLAFNKKDEAQVKKLKEVIAPFLEKVININEGELNEELSFFELRESHHDEASRTTPDIILSKWEQGKGQVI